MSGDDLLCVFANFDVKLKKTKPNVVRSWFDATGTTRQKLLSWLCEPYLTESNYLSSVHRYEFQKIDQPLNLQKCNEELAKFSPSYSEAFRPNHDTVPLLKNDIATLENEEQFYSEMLELLKSVNHQHALNYTFNTKIEIQQKAECETRQSECENLAKELDEVHQKISLNQSIFLKHDRDDYLIGVVDDELLQFDYVFNLNSPSFSTLDETTLNPPEDYSSEILKMYKGRVFRSCQEYLKKEMEVELLKHKLDYLSTLSVNESLSLSCGNLQLPSKDFLERKMCQRIDKIAKVATEQCLESTLNQYSKRELRAHYLKLTRKLNSLDLLTEILSYYALILCIQLTKTRKIEDLSNFYQNLKTYVEKNLLSCRTRTDQMKKKIEQRELYLAKPEMEKYKFVATLGKILNVDNCTLSSVAKAVRQLERQLQLMDNEVMCFSFEKKCPQLDANITVLTQFLTSGPTNKIALIPNEVRANCYSIDEELEKTSEIVRNLTQRMKTMASTSKKFDKYSRLLWMNFLTNPSKVKEIIKEAENDFNNRNKHYF